MIEANDALGKGAGTNVSSFEIMRAPDDKYGVVK